MDYFKFLIINVVFNYCYQLKCIMYNLDKIISNDNNMCDDTQYFYFKDNEPRYDSDNPATPKESIILILIFILYNYLNLNILTYVTLI